MSLLSLGFSKDGPLDTIKGVGKNFPPITPSTFALIGFQQVSFSHFVIYNKYFDICDALRDLVPFVQFKKG